MEGPYEEHAEVVLDRCRLTFQVSSEHAFSVASAHIMLATS